MVRYSFSLPSTWTLPTSFAPRISMLEFRSSLRCPSATACRLLSFSFRPLACVIDVNLLKASSSASGSLLPTPPQAVSISRAIAPTSNRAANFFRFFIGSPSSLVVFVDMFRDLRSCIPGGGTLSLSQLYRTKARAVNGGVP